jgi:PAS domain S-box-containing protein
MVQFISKAVEDIIGYSAEEFKKDPLLLQKITHPEDKKINKKALKNLKEKCFSNREFSIITKNGHVKWINPTMKKWFLYSPLTELEKIFVGDILTYRELN